MAKRNARAAAIVAALDALTDEQRLIAGLDPFTPRDLANNPPAPSENMQRIGIGATNLNTFVRGFINRSFRVPTNKPPLPPGSIKVSNTWADLLKLL